MCGLTWPLEFSRQEPRQRGQQAEDQIAQQNGPRLPPMERVDCGQSWTRSALVRCSPAVPGSGFPEFLLTQSRTGSQTWIRGEQAVDIWLVYDTKYAIERCGGRERMKVPIIEYLLCSTHDSKYMSSFTLAKTCKLHVMIPIK